MTTLGPQVGRESEAPEVTEAPVWRDKKRRLWLMGLIAPTQYRLRPERSIVAPIMLRRGNCPSIPASPEPSAIVVDEFRG